MYETCISTCIRYICLYTTLFWIIIPVWKRHFCTRLRCSFRSNQICYIKNYANKCVHPIFLEVGVMWNMYIIKKNKNSLEKLLPIYPPSKTFLKLFVYCLKSRPGAHIALFYRGCLNTCITYCKVNICSSVTLCIILYLIYTHRSCHHTFL